MAIQIKCGTEDRRNAVKKHPIINGIDYLEILQIKGKDGKIDISIPPFILVFCLKSVKEINDKNIIIKGGVRIKDIVVKSVTIGPDIKKILNEFKKVMPVPSFSDKEIDRLIVVHPSSNGDFSPYMLKIIDSQIKNLDSPPPGFDVLLSQIPFSFNVDCLKDFDCIVKNPCPIEVSPEPDIDYMAKDYSSFLKLMLNRMSTIIPDWKERNPADVGNVLVELFAYVADHLSYFQDSVATEAYLGTALKRISIKRHARLLDYFINEGCNARAWICLEVNSNNDKVIKLPYKTKLVTKGLGNKNSSSSSSTNKIDENPVITGQQFKEFLVDGAEAFETMYEISLHHDLNKIYFYTWGDSRCCLPKGATHATLRNDENKLDGLLKVGDILIFEEVLLPNTVGKIDYSNNANSSHCHTIRISEITNTFDELTEPKTPVIDISWDAEDALSFPLCIWDIEEVVDNNGKKVLHPSSIVHGNVVLADHGYTVPFSFIDNSIPIEDLGSPPENRKFSPSLAFKPLTYSLPFDASLPATFAFKNKIQDACPDIKIGEWDAQDINKNDFTKATKKWSSKRDLFSSDKFAPDFVVEIDNDGIAHIRFGDDNLGSKPKKTSCFGAVYRVGNGKRGNVGAKTITQIVDLDSTGMSLKGKISKVYNPIEAKGGQDNESLKEIRQYAPVAFRTQERAVTVQDYVDLLNNHPEIDRSFAMIRWTGSWYTVFVTIDRLNGKEVDSDFKTKIYNYLNKYRLAGIDLEIQSAQFVSLDIIIKVCVTSGYFRSDVKKVLTDSFSSSILLDGSRGFFHPDNFSFGQPVFISKIYKLAMDVDGVDSVNISRFQRWGKSDNGELAAGAIKIKSFEIIRLDNDPNFPENGIITFIMEGGGL
jgi:hypothetical protein